MKLSKLRLILAVMMMFASISLAMAQRPEIASTGDLPPAAKAAPEWAGDATIYEVNLRQYTPEGTFAAFAEHLPRLREMGIKILWLMPVHPIGEKQRKGTLGSYYSVKDYYDVNPEFGTLDDFRSLVKQVHDHGMYLIIDWVANHSAFDCELATAHPEWYKKGEDGGFVSPYDWTDVIAFDYGQPGIRKYMTECMKWWVRELDIDGFRCDVAGLVPVDFWDNLRAELDRIKPVFMLAEAEELPLMKAAFDADYAWHLMNLMKDVTDGKKKTDDLVVYIQKTEAEYPEGTFKMNFTTNHDENSWNGTEYEKYGEAALALAVFTATIPGMPLVYNGQEEPLKRRLEFFEKDNIGFGNYGLHSFYKTLFAAKRDNPALWNGSRGGRFEALAHNGGTDVVVYQRVKDNNRVVVFLNFGKKAAKVRITSGIEETPFHDLFSGEKTSLNSRGGIELQPYGYKVFTAN